MAEPSGAESVLLTEERRRAEKETRDSLREAEQHLRVIEVRGGPGRLSVASLTELYAFREVLWAFVIRQVKVKYKQAAIGIGWAVLQPVISAALFTVFLGRLAHISSEGRPYLLFALAGMVIWTYFSGAVQGSMESLISNQGLLRKVYFPREILPLTEILAAIVDLVPQLTVLLILTLSLGLRPDITWLALPLPIVIAVLFAMALGIGLSSINLYYRDVRHALPFVLQLGLLASPIAYSLQLVPPRLRTLYAVGNPVAAAIDTLRRILLHHQWPEWSIAIPALLWALVLLTAGAALFKRLERGFADRA